MFLQLTQTKKKNVVFYNLDFFFKQKFKFTCIPFISLNNSYNIVQIVKKIKHISTSLRHRLAKQEMKKIRRKTGHRHGDETHDSRRRGLSQPRNIYSL